MRCPAIEGIETGPARSLDGLRARRGRMRCPAIEGIETVGAHEVAILTAADQVECVAPLLRGLKRIERLAAERPWLRYVECVAPLLRGLKPRDGLPRLVQRMAAGRMRCPAIEGIETRRSVLCEVGKTLVCRMRCPAIEGIETRKIFPAQRTVRGWVECVAPLLRGLKRMPRKAPRNASSNGSRMRCPAIEGIETLKVRCSVSQASFMSNALPRY